MPPLIRQTMIFNLTTSGGRSSGWSETHYSVTALTLPGALTNLIALARVRVNMLGAGVVLRYLRVSDDAVFRDVRSEQGITPLVGPHGPYYLGIWRDVISDVSYSAALVRCQGETDFYTRSLFISGNPDVGQDIEHPTPFGVAWLQQFAEFQNALLVGGKFGFKVQDRETSPQINIIGLAAGVFTTQVPHGLVPGDRVRIRGFTALPGVDSVGNPNGLWYIDLTPSNTTFSLLGYRMLTFNPRRLGSVRKIVFKVTKYTSVQLASLTKKSRGRPFGLLVGRRRRRAT